jgi:signal transduction histidine kinase
MQRCLLIILIIVNFLFISFQRSPKEPAPLTPPNVSSLFAKLKGKVISQSTIPLLDSIIYYGKLSKSEWFVKTAYGMRNQYYWQHLPPEEEKKMIAAVREVEAYAKNIKDEDTYFRGWNALISFYLSNRMYVKGVIEINKFKEEAIRKKLPVYEGWSYKNLGNMYYTQSDYEMAIQNYKMGCKVAEKYNDLDILSYNYTMSGTSYVWLKKYNEAIDCYQKSNDCLKSINRIGSVLGNKVHMALCYYYLRNFDKMQELLDEVDNKRFNDQFIRNSYYELKAYDCVRKKDFDKAMQYADSVHSAINRYQIKCTVCQLTGNVKGQADYLNKIVKQDISVFPSSKDTRKIIDEKLYELTKLSKDSFSLNKQNEQLQLRNELLRNMMQNNKWRQESITKNTEMEISKSQVARAQLQARLENARHDQLMNNLLSQRQSFKYSKIIYSVILVSALLIIGWLFLLLRSKKRYNNRLAQEKDSIINLQKVNEQLNIEAQKAKEDAEESDHLKDLFIKQISQVVRTSLNSIVGFSNILTSKEIEGDETAKQKLKNIVEQSSHQLSEVVNSVLDLTNLQKGKYKMNYTQVLLEEVCTTAFEAERVNASKNISMSFIISGECKNLLIYTDMQRVMQALMCLLNNACKFTKEGAITFSCEKTEENNRSYISFIISDTGIGIPREMEKDIFSPFIKIDEFSKGYGLGLAFCSEIANRLGGKCCLDTNYTKGARFFFVIPMLNEAPLTEGGEG